MYNGFEIKRNSELESWDILTKEEVIEFDPSEPKDREVICSVYREDVAKMLVDLFESDLVKINEWNCRFLIPEEDLGYVE